MTVTDVEGQMLGTLRGAFAEIKDKPVSELGADWRNEMFARVASVRASFVDAYKSRQGEIVSALKTSVTNGFQVGAQTTKRDLSAAGIRYPDRVYTMNDATRGTEQIATAFTRTLAAEATSIDAATQAFVSAIAAVSAGVGGTVAQVFDAAVLPRVRNGLTGVVTASGAELGVANYLEGLTRETSQQALLVGESVVADAAGLHLVRISAHTSCCPKCAPWQGQILVDDYFAKGQPDGVHGSLRAAIDAGLFHWNCRHKKTIWYPGIKEAKEREDYDPDKVEKTYQIEQQQRALERKIREYKRLAATALDPDTAAHAEQNVRIYQAALSKLVADARRDHYPIYRQYNKEQVGFDYGKWDPYGIHGGPDDDFHGGGYNGGGSGGSSGASSGSGATIAVNRPALASAQPQSKGSGSGGLTNAAGSATMTGIKALDNAPRLTPEQSDSIATALLGANPEYETDRAYNINCQRCVYIYEARRRGYDVNAAPRPSANDPLKPSWKDVMTDGAASYKNTGGRTAADARQRIEQQMAGFGDGARAMVYVKWNQKGAHVFIAEQINGVTRFIDPQSGETNCTGYFTSGRIIPRFTGLLRIDDKDFTSLIEECIA